LLLNPLYVSLLLAQRLSLKSFDPEDSVRPTSESLFG
jgi:hypothetical protein